MLDISSGFDAQRIDACPDRAAVMEVQDLSVAYGAAQALRNVSFALYPREILAFIGPSGCGKTTALKCLNRMHDGIRDVKITGKITMGGQDIMARDVDPPLHRRRFGWVAQKPNPFPCSVFENVAYGARLHGLTNSPAALEAHVESCLRRADLWAEVKDDLFTRSGYELSGGQQQRLCIARALATEPEVMLMDEPTGSIDPVATDHVEALMKILAQDLSVLVITHSLMQARRLADRIGYFHLGQLREIGPTEQIFTNPKDRLTRDFIMGLHG